MTGFAKIRQGVRNFDIEEVEEGIQLWAAALTEVNQALKDCGAEHAGMHFLANFRELTPRSRGDCPNLGRIAIRCFWCVALHRSRNP